MNYAFKRKGRQPTFWLGVAIVCLLGVLQSSCLSRPASITAGREGVGVELWASNECPEPGEIVALRATATNDNPHLLRVELKDQPVLDMSIFYRTQTGEKTIHWSDGKPLTSDLTRLELNPGESKSIEMQWSVVSEVSAVGVSAKLIDDPHFVKDPINPLMVLHIGNCPGLFGP